MDDQLLDFKAPPSKNGGAFFAKPLKTRQIFLYYCRRKHGSNEFFGRKSSGFGYFQEADFVTRVLAAAAVLIWSAMRKKRRRGGRFRLIILVIIFAAAAVAVFRFAAGRHKDFTVVEVSAGAEESAGSGNGADSSAAGTSADEIAVSGTAGSGSLEGADLQASGAVGDAASAKSGSGSSGDSGTAASGARAESAAAAETGGQQSAAVGTGAASVSSTGASAAQSYNHVSTELEKGKEYLDSLDKRSPIDAQYEIDLKRAEYEKEKEKQAYREKRELYRQTLEEDGVWEQFEDYVFLGDSRIVGFNVFGYLPEERVLAEAGDTILEISNRMDTIKELSPEYIFLSYGINDIGIGYWTTAEDYAKAFGEKIDELHDELPDAQIFVNSIIPATKEAVEGTAIWGKIPEYSEALRAMCEKKGIPFIDNGDLIEEHRELYAGDGVHLNTEFYQYWAENQLLAIYDVKNGRKADGTIVEKESVKSSQKASGKDAATDEESAESAK